MAGTRNIVEHDGNARWSDLWRTEDYWAIWIGFALLILAYAVYVQGGQAKLADSIARQNAIIRTEAAKAPFKTVDYLQAQARKSRMLGTSLPVSKQIAWLIAAPGKWTDNPVTAFFVSDADARAKNQANREKAIAASERAQATLATARFAEKAAEKANFQDETLNGAAISAIAVWQDAAKEASRYTSAKPRNLFASLPLLLVCFLGIFGIGNMAMGRNLASFAVGFTGLFAIVLISMTIGRQAGLAHYGLGVEPVGIIVGLVIANTVGTPKWMKPALQVEYFIKTGLVLLGAEILFDKIVAIGVPGIFVAWVVTPIVLVCTFLFGQKVLKMASPSLNITISADMSVCGTSAAIAVAAACRAKKEELTLAVGLSLAFTAIMMIALPAVIHALGMPEVLGGAWIGGTIDSTGAVAAAGALLGQKAMYVAATIKMIQNVLIGVCAFGVAVYWCTRIDNTAGRHVGAMEIWNRFPKFILGFLLASVVFSWLSASLGPDLGTALINKGVLNGLEKGVRTWFFVLAFTAIGLSTNFRELSAYFKDGKPLILYVCGQTFNLMLTLAMAYVMFYMVFPEVTAKI